MEIIRATETWQQAGAYYVRIQAMARKHSISLRKEFDEYDTPDTKYIVIMDGFLPIATGRLIFTSDTNAKIGRIVVLEEYRGKGIGRLVVSECEKWLKEEGIISVSVDARENKSGFYKKLGYIDKGEPIIKGDTFNCISMEKTL